LEIARVRELTVAAGLARRLLDFAEAKGISRAALTRRSGLDSDEVEDQDARVPLPRYVALMRAAKELSGDPALPLHYGGTVDMAEFSIVGMLFRCCETLMEAIQQVNRYGRLVVEVDVGAADRFQLARRDGGLWLTDTRRNPNDFIELTEATFARFAGMVKPVVGDVVLEVQVTHAEPPHGAAYRAFFGVPVRFGAPWNALRLHEERLTWPILTQPRYVFGIFSARAQALLDRLERSKTVRGRVESLLLPILHSGEANFSRVAGGMGLSRDTLYRKLRAEGVTFEKVLDALRRELALDYLGGGKLSVHETAYLVGFSDAAAFSRAFKRWTGRNPSAFRGGKMDG
jgi:AraC-like DNA-binding protein